MRSPRPSELLDLARDLPVTGADVVALARQRRSRDVDALRRLEWLQPPAWCPQASAARRPFRGGPAFTL